MFFFAAGQMLLSVHLLLLAKTLLLRISSKQYFFFGLLLYIGQIYSTRDDDNQPIRPAAIDRNIEKQSQPTAADWNLSGSICSTANQKVLFEF